MKESEASSTCVVSDTCTSNDNRIYPTEEICCAPGVAFPNGCKMTQAEARLERGGTPCFVRGEYYPSQQCRRTFALCLDEPSKTGVFVSESDCCRPGAAFPDGCGAKPPVPCWQVDDYAARTCRESEAPWVCNRGWGVYPSEETCLFVSFGGN